MQFFHLYITNTGISRTMALNLSKEEALFHYLCPFINREVTLSGEHILNTMVYGRVWVYRTARPVDSLWPINRSEASGPISQTADLVYYDNLSNSLEDHEANCSEVMYREAVVMIGNGTYKAARARIAETYLSSPSAFMVSKFGDEEIDHNYEFVIKPSVERRQIQISRVDEISHARTINEVILEQIRRATFVVADLTGTRPNCFYEVGYAHALGKPVILLAKEGTERPFDISSYKWTYWTTYRDLKPKFDAELEGVLAALGRQHESQQSSR